MKEVETPESVRWVCRWAADGVYGSPRIKKSVLLEAEEAPVRGDHDVVQDLDAEEFARLKEPDR